MKLTDYELRKMQLDINDIIDNSRMSIDIHNLSEIQPNFNTRLKDFDGPESYDIQTDIPVELVGTDDSIKYLSKLDKNPAGNKYNGLIMINIPIMFDRVIDPETTIEEWVTLQEDSYIIYKSERYKVVVIHPKEYENSVLMHKMVGD